MATRLIFLAAVLMLAVIGCGGGEQASTNSEDATTESDLIGAPTPEEAILGLRDAILAGDEEAFMARFSADDTNEEMFKASVALSVAIMNLDRKVTEAFGEAEATRLLRGQDDPFDYLKAIDEEDLDISVAADGYSAMCKFNGGADRMMLARMPAGWVGTEIPEDGPMDEETKEGIKLFGLLVTALTEAGDAAGEDGMTAEKFEGVLAAKLAGVAVARMAPDPQSE